MERVISSLIQGEGYRATIDLVAGHVPVGKSDFSPEVLANAGEKARLVHAYIQSRPGPGEKLEMGRVYHVERGEFSVMRVGEDIYSVGTDDQALHFVVEEL